MKKYFLCVLLVLIIGYCFCEKAVAVDVTHWDFFDQKDQFTECYKNKDLSGYLQLCKDSVALKEYENQRGKELDYFNPLNVPAGKNDVAWLKEALKICPDFASYLSQCFGLSSDNQMYPLAYAVIGDGVDTAKYLISLKTKYTEEEHYFGEMYHGFKGNLVTLAKSDKMIALLLQAGYPKTIKLSYPKDGKSLKSVKLKKTLDDSEATIPLSANVNFQVNEVSSFNKSGLARERWIFIEASNGTKGWYYITSSDGDDSILIEEEHP